MQYVATCIFRAPSEVDVFRRNPPSPRANLTPGRFITKKILPAVGLNCPIWLIGIKE